MVKSRFTKPNGGNYAKVEKTARENGVSEQKKWFETRKSTLFSKIKKALGDSLALPFVVQTCDYEQKIAYEISLPAKRIRMLDNQSI